MATPMIEVIAGDAPENELPFIQVHSYPSPGRPFVTISTITTGESDGRSLIFTTVVDRHAMHHAEALERAKILAGEKKWPRIYARDDTAK